MKKLLFYWLKILVLAFIICLPVILPYFKSGFFPTHDGEWAVVRLGDMYREIKDLQFPARFSGYLNFEYGYPLFNFAYPMPYYLGVIFVFLKLGFVNSVKFLFLLSTVLSFFSMFLLSESLWKNKWAGIISGIFYIYVPYRIIDLYVRGSIGESLSFVLFPLILLGIKNIHDSKKPALAILLTGILYGLLITTHNIMAVLFGLLILFIAIVFLFKKEFKFLLNLFLSIIYSLCFSAFFWMPAIFEKNLILLSKIPIADRSLYFVNPAQIIIERWGYAPPTEVNGFGYQIGIAQIAIFILVIAAAIFRYKTKDSKITLLLALAVFAFSFLLFRQSGFLWLHTPLLSEINYPWTILAILMFLISLMAGYLTKLGKHFLIVSIVLCLVGVWLILPHAKPQYSVNRGDEFYITNQATTTSSNELMPLWVKKLPVQKAENKIDVASGTIENLSSNSKRISFSANLPSVQKVKINTIYYPGWEVFVDGKLTKIDYHNENGIMTVDVSRGTHQILAKFTETPIRLLSDIISLASIISLVLYLVFVGKFKRMKIL